MDIYAYQRLVGRIDDNPELKESFITIYDVKSHKEIVRFCLLLGQHLIERTGFTPAEVITSAFEAMNKWLEGKVNYHESRNLSLP